MTILREEIYVKMKEKMDSRKKVIETIRRKEIERLDNIDSFLDGLVDDQPLNDFLNYFKIMKLDLHIDIGSRLIYNIPRKSFYISEKEGEYSLVKDTVEENTGYLVDISNFRVGLVFPDMTRGKLEKTVSERINEVLEKKV